jgi:hypothetical protein
MLLEALCLRGRKRMQQILLGRVFGIIRAEFPVTHHTRKIGLTFG